MKKGVAGTNSSVKTQTVERLRAKPKFGSHLGSGVICLGAGAVWGILTERRRI